MNWSPEQSNELAAHYRDLPDEDLLQLAATPEDLTDLANQVLEKEMIRRKLVLAAFDGTHTHEEFLVDRDPSGEDSSDAPGITLAYALHAPDFCTFSFATLRQANDARAFLAESKIDSEVLSSDNDSFDPRGPRVVVRPADADQAAAILSQPIPDHIAAEPDPEHGDFALPTCPHCGAPDPLLEAVDPVNHWRCEACDHQWDDPA